MSNLYPSLSLLKDLLKLNSPNAALPYLRRHTSLNPILSTASEDILRDISRDLLESNYAFPFESTLVSAVLASADTARLRDLPAYLLCSTKLQSSLTKYMTNPQPEDNYSLS